MPNCFLEGKTAALSSVLLTQTRNLVTSLLQRWCNPQNICPLSLTVLFAQYSAAYFNIGLKSLARQKHVGLENKFNIAADWWSIQRKKIAVSTKVCESGFRSRSEHISNICIFFFFFLFSSTKVCRYSNVLASSFWSIYHAQESDSDMLIFLQFVSLSSYVCKYDVLLRRASIIITNYSTTV